MINKNVIILIFLSHFVFLCNPVIAGLPDDDIANLEGEIKKAKHYLETGNKNEASRIYSKLAYKMHQAGSLDKAIEFYNIVLQINIESNNITGQMKLFNTIALVQMEANDYANAVGNFKKELELRRAKGDKWRVVGTLNNIASAQLEMSYFDEALAYVDEAIMLSKELNSLNLLKRSYGNQHKIYLKKGNKEKAAISYENYSAINNRLKEQQMDEITHEAEQKVSKVTIEKKQTETLLNKTHHKLEETESTLQQVEELTKEQEMELKLSQAKIKAQDAMLKAEQMRRTFWMVGFSVMVLFVLVLTYMIMQIRKANKKINKQRLKLVKQNKEIRESIQYAKTIQQAMLPDEGMMKEIADNFIIFRPKDIVSGDFYWSTKSLVGDVPTYYLAVVDCTGHGVPGSIMSMIGNSLLNEIVIEKKVTIPSKVLVELNDHVREALRQEQTDNNDGMDLSLCKIQKTQNNKYKLVYSGAKRPLYIIKALENKMVCFKGDRFSIGGYKYNKRNIEFSDHEIELESNDTIYMFSDGIVDQNGPERKKFGRIRLEEILYECSKRDVSEQRMIIEKELTEYMQREAQRDDITMVGLKIK